MQAYRCGNCRADLIEGSVLCANCDSLFDRPVPDGGAPTGKAGYLMPSAIPLTRSRAAMRRLGAGLAAMTAVCLAAALACNPAQFLREAQSADAPTIRQAVEADLAADQADSYASRRYATDVMLSLSTRCSIHHSSYSRKPGDVVLMVSCASLTPKQARNRALFAAYLLRDLREGYYSDSSDQSVRIMLLDAAGGRFTTTVTPRQDGIGPSMAS